MSISHPTSLAQVLASSLKLFPTPLRREAIYILDDLPQTNKASLPPLNVGTITSIVDYGSGIGVKTEIIANRYNDAKITGIEIDTSKINRANQSKSQNITYIQHDITYPSPLKNNTADMAFINYPPPADEGSQRASLFELMLKDARRVVRKGGIITIESELLEVHTHSLSIVRLENNLSWYSSPPRPYAGCQKYSLQLH